MKRFISSILVLVPALTLADSFTVDAEVGNSTFDAVFDAKLGERIHAVSSSVGCSISFDEKTGTASGSCAVPLTSIIVDNEPTKTEHFHEWATNKKSEPKVCKLEARFEAVKVSALRPEKPVPFSAQVPFTVCGRARDDQGKEKVTGTAILFPAGSYGEKQTIRIQATVKGFNRERYRIGPGFTEGWLARVQSLAKVVAAEGDIELRLFAKSAAPPSTKAALQ